MIYDDDNYILMASRCFSGHLEKYHEVYFERDSLLDSLEYIHDKYADSYFQNDMMRAGINEVIEENKAIEEYNCKNLVLAGGVAANSYLRNELKEACDKANIEFSYPRIAYCTDNAAMIGAAAYYAYKKGKTADLTLNAVAVETLYNEE